MSLSRDVVSRPARILDPGHCLTLRPMVYPDAKWQVIAQGDDVTINTVPLGHGEEGRVPANYLVLRTRRNGSAS